MRIPSLMRVLCLPAVAPAAEKFSLKDGDRVVLLGNTLVEREQLSGWWELALTTRFHGKKITFRNLGWSGDDVYGTSRAGFGDANLGFKELKDHTLALTPSVLIIGYGNVEAFDGPAGKEKFRKGLERLLDTLAPTKARVVLLSPVAPAKLGKPFPDPAKQIENVRLYAQVVSEVAAKRGHSFVDLFGVAQRPRHRPHGEDARRNHLDGRGIPRDGPRVREGRAGPRRTNRCGSRSVSPRSRISPIRGDMREGRGDRVTRSGRVHVEHRRGGTMSYSGPRTSNDGLFVRPSEAEREQLEKLRKLIVAKNELYFHRWRPQNETYLFGFRKYEQGNNAREIPLFDPLVEAKEKEIAALAKPRTLKLELKHKRKVETIEPRTARMSLPRYQAPPGNGWPCRLRLLFSSEASR